MPGTVNIVLNHNPNDFDHAVDLGIDLMLAGHTHGGQLSLESLRRGISFARIETPYVSGWYEKSGGQFYVNRGMGTTIIPIRAGARPEITVLGVWQAKHPMPGFSGPVPNSCWPWTALGENGAGSGASKNRMKMPNISQSAISTRGLKKL